MLYGEHPLHLFHQPNIENHMQAIQVELILSSLELWIRSLDGGEVLSFSDSSLHFSRLCNLILSFVLYTRIQFTEIRGKETSQGLMHEK